MKKSIYQIKMGTIVVYDNLTYERAKTLKKQLQNEGFRNINIKTNRNGNGEYKRRVA